MSSKSYCYIFFFSSRRRHTRFKCDWSSDVCSSDLDQLPLPGREVAAGQRQLIALARAHLVDPAILLLDEATAALDLAAEAEVNRATEQLAALRTTLVVAHRLTTASQADRIVVLADGEIAEVGSHGELLELNGAYAAMWAAFTGEPELVA